MRRQRNYGLWLALLAILVTTGCGIRPKNLEPPAGTDPNQFPRQYPSE